MADQRRGEQLCEHQLSRQVRRSGGAGKPAFAGSDLREDGDVWPSRRPPSRRSCCLAAKDAHSRKCSSGRNWSDKGRNDRARERSRNVIKRDERRGIYFNELFPKHFSDTFPARTFPSYTNGRLQHQVSVRHTPIARKPSINTLPIVFGDGSRSKTFGGSVRRHQRLHAG